ncbi:MAG TPA: Na+/H+ antiporter, partial [Candidatus Dormibacteraeota bacterium]
MRSAEFILSLLIAVAVLVTVARRLGVAYPIFLVLGGLALGLVPRVPHIEVAPDVIFVLVLPPIVYIASAFTPLRTL